jgi:arylsulfatase A-like enzyme
VATAPETEPATASLLTDTTSRVRAWRNGQRLPDDLTTLAERAAAAGWQTAAIVCNPLLTADYGFAQGFAHFAHIEREGRATDDRAVDAAIAWLATARPGSSGSSDGPHGRHGGRFVAQRRVHLRRALRGDPPVRVGRNVELGVFRAQAMRPRPARSTSVADGDVRFTDDQIGGSSTSSDARFAADTLVVLVADHGESPHRTAIRSTPGSSTSRRCASTARGVAGRVPAGRKSRRG